MLGILRLHGCLFLHTLLRAMITLLFIVKSRTLNLSKIEISRVYRVHLSFFCHALMLLPYPCTCQEPPQNPPPARVFLVLVSSGRKCKDA
ncbi:hypothetical protein GGI43DRAFT_277815 [Trichoderma evansii]